MKLDIRTGALGAALVAASVFSLANWPLRTPRAGAEATPAVTVTMTANRFSPGTVHVKAGGTLVWKNTSEMVHTVTGDGFDSGNVAPGASYQRTFTKPGTFAYHCIPHQQAGMVGTVVVDP